MIIDTETVGGIKTNYAKEYKGEFIGGNMFKFEIGDKVSYKGKEYKVSSRYLIEDSTSRVYYELKNDNECTGWVLESELSTKLPQLMAVIMRNEHIESVIPCSEINVRNTYLKGGILAGKVIQIKY